jgi:hypothetical protein
MSLPVVDVPIYELKLPSNGKEIKVRPFLVKEEKLLLMAAESNDVEEIIKTTKQVINNCLINKDVDVDKLPFFDIDYLFIALRAKSIAETIEMRFTCNAIDNDGNACRHTFETEIDISKTEIFNNNIPKAIKFDNDAKNTSVKMKYPSYNIMKTLNEKDNALENKIKVIVACIDQIAQKDKVYSSKDYTPRELQIFVEGLTQENYKKLELFVDNFPYFAVEVEKKCPKCGYLHDIRYTDFASFFY